MSIKFGMPSLIELETLEDNIELCKELGLEFIELNLNVPEFQPEILINENLKEIGEKENIFFTFHVPDDLDVAHESVDVRNGAVKHLEKTLDLAESIGSPVVNMHMNKGIYFTLPDKKILVYGKDLNYYVSKLSQVTNLMNEKKYQKVKLMIENTGIYNLDFIAQGVEYLIQNDSIDLTYDVGHEYIYGGNDTDLLKKYEGQIKHMHFHDCIGTKDHNAAFSGELDLVEKLDLADRNDCLVVIEVKTVEGLKHSVSALKERNYL